MEFKLSSNTYSYFDVILEVLLVIFLEQSMYGFEDQEVKNPTFQMVYKSNWNEENIIKANYVELK